MKDTNEKMKRLITIYQTVTQNTYLLTLNTYSMTVNTCLTMKINKLFLYKETLPPFKWRYS